MKLPMVSVILPVRNEAAYIRRNVLALVQQEYPADRLEIVVADGRSEDGTAEEVRDLVHELATLRPAHGSTVACPMVRLVDNPDRIMPTGVNAGIVASRGEIIVLVGGHAELPPRYVRACVEALVVTGADAVGGALDSRGRGRVGETIAAAMSSPLGIGNSVFRTGASDVWIAVDTIPFPAYRRSVFERVGLFNPAMVRHQDYELHWRLRRAGGRLVLLPWLRATYFVRSSLRALWRQYHGNGIWKGRFVRRHPASLRARHLAPPLLVPVLALAALAPLTRVAALGALGYVAYLLAASVALGVARGWRLAPVAPAVLAVLHLGYGLGFWQGLFMARVTDAPRLEAVTRSMEPDDWLEDGEPPEAA